MGIVLEILIIDDEKALVDALGSLLMEEFSCSVHLAYSGEEGLRKSQSKKYDIIISDLRMPGLSGLDLIQSTRGDVKNLNYDTPFILSTGTPEDIDVDGSLGETFILRKPYKFEAFFKLIREISK